MAETFLTRIPTLTEAELQAYLDDPLAYRTEAVEAALAELDRRGAGPAPERQAQVRAALAQREAAARDLHPGDGSPGAGPAQRRRRRRRIAAAILAVGLSGSALAFVRARPPAPNPLGYEPEDTKKYLRDLELYGGKANVLATEFRRWFERQWQGRRLAGTLAALSLLLAAPFWVAGRPGPTDEHTGAAP